MSLESDAPPVQTQPSAIDPQVAMNEGASPEKESSPAATKPENPENRYGQVRQLIKQALETTTADGLVEFLDFGVKFRRLAETVGRKVLPDAIPIIILWPFSPIRFVYELEDTGPPINRSSINDPFAARGKLSPKTWGTLLAGLDKQKAYKIIIEPRRQGFDQAGSAARQGVLNLTDGAKISDLVRENGTHDYNPPVRDGVPSYRITVNDRLEPNERFVTVAHELGHIFCGHLGGITPRSGNEESGWPDRRHLGTKEQEIEAEAVAYLAASRAGIVTNSASYLKGYAETADIAKVSLELIVRAAARIERLAKIHYGSLLLWLFAI